MVWEQACKICIVIDSIIELQTLEPLAARCKRGAEWGLKARYNSAQDAALGYR